MRSKSFTARMKALEAARWGRLTALERAEELAARGVPVEQWPDAELEAYCQEAYRAMPALRTMSDAELEALGADEDA